MSEVDARIAELLGMKVMGIVTCALIEGEWGAYPDTEPENWSCYAEKWPVYLSRCCCDIREEDDQTAFGYTMLCFGVVPHYSTDPVECAELDKIMWDKYKLALDATRQNDGTYEAMYAAIVQTCCGEYMQPEGYAVEPTECQARATAAVRALEKVVDKP